MLKTKKIIVLTLAIIMVVLMFPVTVFAFPVYLSGQGGTHQFAITEEGVYSFRIEHELQFVGMVLQRENGLEVVEPFRTQLSVVQESGSRLFVSDFSFNLSPGDYRISLKQQPIDSFANVRMFTGTTVPQGFTVDVDSVGGGLILGSRTGVWPGETVHLWADAFIAEGYRFERWEVVSGGVTFDLLEQSSTFIMPANNVEIRAVFEKVPNAPIFSASSGSWMGFIRSGAQLDNGRLYVDVSAEPFPFIGYEFVEWTVLSGNVNFDTNEPELSLVLNDGEYLEIAAVWGFDPALPIVNVINGWVQIGKINGQDYAWLNPSFIEGYEFERWEVTSNNQSITFGSFTIDLGWGNYFETTGYVFPAPATGTIEIEAIFRQLPPAPTANVFSSNNAWGQVETFIVAQTNTAIVLTDTPTGFEFERWVVRSGNTTISDTGLTAVAANGTVRRAWAIELPAAGHIEIEAIFRRVQNNNNNNNVSTPPPSSSGGGTSTALVSPVTVWASGDVLVAAEMQQSTAILNPTELNITQILDRTTDMVAFDLSPHETITHVTIPQRAWRQFATAERGVQIIMAHATIELDIDAVVSINPQVRSAGVTVSVVPLELDDLTALQQKAVNPQDDIYRILVQSAGRNVTSFDGVIETTVAYDGESNVGAWRLTEDGTQTEIPSVFDDHEGLITFTKTELSVFLVGLMKETVAQPRILRFPVGSAVFIDNGVSHAFEAASFIAEDRTMVPLRVIAEALGATNLNFVDGVVSFILNGELILMEVGQPLPNNMGTPVIVEDRTFVPLIFIVTRIGATVRWDEDAEVAYVYIG